MTQSFFKRKPRKSDVKKVMRLAQVLSLRCSTDSIKISLELWKAYSPYVLTDKNNIIVGWCALDESQEKHRLVTIATKDGIQNNSSYLPQAPIASRPSSRATGANDHAGTISKHSSLVDDSNHDIADVPLSMTECDALSELQQGDSFPHENDSSLLKSEDDAVYEDLIKYSRSNYSKRKKRAHPIVRILCVISIIALLGLSAYKYANKAIMSAQRYNVDHNVSSDLILSDYQQLDDPDEIVHITVDSGDTVHNVKKKMLENGLVSSGWSLDDYISQPELKAGEYLITGKESSEEIAGRMKNSDLAPDFIIGINPGDDIKHIAEKIDTAVSADDSIQFDGDDFTRQASQVILYKACYPVFRDVPDSLPSIEGYIPEGEYNLEAYDNADGFIKSLLNKTEADFESRDMSSRDYYAVLTKASMIEKEAMIDDDRALIASVIDNRLTAGMPLQIDATVKYALGSDEQRVMDSDLTVDSPYNTYMHAGLPIGPICSGIDDKDIDAVEHHPDTDYYYYVLKDKQGHHEFCETQEQFSEAKDRYLELFGYGDE